MRTRDALRLSEEQYRWLADHSSGLVLRLADNGETRFATGAAHRLLGVDPRLLEGTAVSESIHEEDRARFRTAIDRTLRNGEAVTCVRLRHACGQHRWVEAHVRLANSRDPERDGTTLVATLHDIHQRRTAELLAAESANRLRETNRLLLMAEQLASLGHWVFDSDAGELLLSPEAATMLGLSELTIAPRAALALVEGGDRNDLRRALLLALRRDEPVECIVHCAGEGASGERTLQLRIQRRGSDDRAPALFGVISDITDKLESEHRLVAALAEARSAAEFRKQFLATMSHEIRTPMTGVVGMIELLCDNPAPAERKLYLDTLRQSADLLMKVLNDVLDFSKVDAGQMHFADEPFDLGQTLLATLRLFDRAASARGIDLRIVAPAPGARWLRGDPLRLQQVVSNLLSNAIKFSERSAVVLRCSLSPRAGGRVALRLSVEDKGAGIPADVQEQLFEPFVQGASAAGRGGTGLGLAICRRLVDGMGGTIALRSAIGKGSSFTVALTLPVATPRRAASDMDDAQPNERPLDLLLAEDNPVNQLLVTALLKRMGHRVTCAGDGESAVELAGRRRFDLVLMDMQMPRCDGLTATARIRSGDGPNRATPIIALTADATGDRRSLYAEQGVNLLLTKPVDSGALAAALASLAAPGEPASACVARSDGAPPPLDGTTLDELRALLGPARLDGLLALLSAELEERPRAIRDALADRALDRAGAEAHSLKGAAANLGACVVAAAAEELEEAVRAAEDDRQTDLGPVLRRLMVAVDEAREAIGARAQADRALAVNG
ncbi:hypothetical protein GCM10022280_02230 [Sphingomonas swuensis]|uniref:histidine kinase n=2 Tax=Sphingomonas swuensis TaxID=977800 RepID=A0ABP7SA90_9SPHN